ncbi:MAG: DnaJ domain-containing protein [Planctomycetes bacterium]|nr:DnaJ domain-containing protein [Planctomycetota bacterium]
MPDRSSLLHWVGRFLFGVALLVLAGSKAVPRLLHVNDPIGLLTIAVGLVGFHFALGAATPMARLLAGQRLRRKWGDQAHDIFVRASLPRRIYYLLVAVAEADGPITVQERGAVRHFVRERFADPVTVEELQTWESQPLPIDDREGLAMRIGAGLDDTELDSLFCWCCLVAFADGRFGVDEHRALQDVAKGLDLAGPRARMLFHLARAQFLRGDTKGQRGGPHPRQPHVADARAEALAVLDLPAEATPEQIRKRHRDLVRRFHPDAQAKLGPVAQKEATERFLAIQRAYETLST